MNIRQIAKLADVSIATISRATNPETRFKVSAGTLKRLDGLFRKHAYTPNLAAKNLTRQKTKIIGVVFPYVRNIFYSSYYTHILAGVANYLLNSGYQFKLILLKEGEKKWDDFDFKAGEGVEGLIVSQWFRLFTPKVVAKRINVPFVVISDFAGAVKTRFVYEDGFMGGRLVAKYLYENGHRIIGVIDGPVWSWDSKQRIKGFISFFMENGLAFNKDLIVRGHFDFDEQTYQAVDSILEREKKVSAIFCCNDNMAFMAIQRLKERGLACPKDVSVIGYDDDFRAAQFAPPLTTINVPVYDLAQKAAAILLERLKGNISEKKFSGLTPIPVKLIERNSVRKIN